MHKYELFHEGITKIQVTTVTAITRFKQGSLPVRYPGIPLISSKLRWQDYLPLIDKIMSRITSWRPSCLSYAGIWQLITRYSTHFCCSDFILPTKHINKIQQIRTSFLWKGKETSRKGAKVSWDDICLPPSEGELGIKDI